MTRSDFSTPESIPDSHTDRPISEVTVECLPPEGEGRVSRAWDGKTWRQTFLAWPLGSQVAITVVGLLTLFAVLKALISLVASLITLACFGGLLYGLWRIARSSSV